MQNISFIAPNGDVDVSTCSYNTSIDRLSNCWERQNVKCLSGKRYLFYGNDGLPTSRYCSYDYILLSYSGIKRLLDAMNTSTKLVIDYQLSIFDQSKTLGVRNQQPTTQYRRMNVGKLFNPAKRNQPKVFGGNNTQNPVSSFGNSSRRCFGCQMIGHVISECWHIK